MRRLCFSSFAFVAVLPLAERAQQINLTVTEHPSVGDASVVIVDGGGISDSPRAG
jgi:hypothetical protein